MYTIKHLCGRFKLSRSALLYYDSIGLLKPSCRAGNNYRKYSEEDIKRLEQICTYRQAGVTLDEIKRILSSSDNTLLNILEKRLDELNNEIKHIKAQQNIIIRILQNDEVLNRLHIFNKNSWIKLLSSAGFDEADMLDWHAEFEKQSPDSHQKFLEALCIHSDEIKELRESFRDYCKTQKKEIK